MLSFKENVKVTRVSNAVAAGTTDVECTGVDMTGFNSITFMAAFGTITGSAVTSVKAQASDDDGSTDTYSDLEGTSITVADDTDNKVVLLEVVKPTKKYIRLVIDRGTQNAVVDGAFAFQTGLRSGPVTQPTSVLGSEIHETPDEGTA